MPQKHVGGIIGQIRKSSNFDGNRDGGPKRPSANAAALYKQEALDRINKQLKQDKAEIAKLEAAKKETPKVAEKEKSQPRAAVGRKVSPPKINFSKAVSEIAKKADDALKPAN